MLRSEMRKYFIPIIDVAVDDYNKNKDNIVEFIESEAKRLKSKDCELILVNHLIPTTRNIMLARKETKDENVALSNQCKTIQDQYNCIIEIMGRRDTKLLKEY